MDEDTRKTILLLLYAFKQYQVRALSLNTALASIIRLSPEDRAALTADRIEAAVMDARKQIEKVVEQQSSQLEQALQDDKHALETLQAFASMHLRNQ